MAEAIFNKFCDTDSIMAYSAGISVVSGSKTSHNAAYVVKKYINEDIINRKAVQLTGYIVESSNLIFTMTEHIKSMLINNFPDFHHKIFTLKEFILQKGDIIDPFGGDVGDYEVAYRELEESILALLKKLKEGIGIT
ncbi:low molecular weight protein arginine phosphatase [Clostridium sp. LBM24168]